MAKMLGARKNAKFKAVCTAPSFNKTPMGNSIPPLPYAVTQDLGSSVGVVSSVRFNRDPAYVLNNSTQPSCKGDAAGSAKGVKSGTTSGEVKPVEGSSSVRVGGQPIIRDGDPCTLNKGNCPGIYTTQPGANGTIKGGAPTADTNPKSGGWGWGWVSSLTHAVLGVASFIPGVSVVTGALDAALYAAEGNYTEAALALASTIPGGKLAVTAGRAITKGVKAVQASKAVQQLAKGATAAKAAVKKLGAKIKEMWKKLRRDKPSICCPKNKAGPKGVMTGRPVHLATGEEILEQTDFELEGPSPLAWTRTYRSGSECEDWGLLGARWATPFTSSLSVTPRGIVYHEDSGRALRLPALVPGADHDCKSEGFILRCDNDTQFTLTWRDGSTDTFVRSGEAQGWLPHGYDGANAMLAPRAPFAAARFHLTRSAGRDGKGFHVERFPDAEPGGLLLRVRVDDGRTLEALREEHLGETAAAASMHPRIGRIDEVHADGTRLCHVRYRYEAETGGPGLPPNPTAAQLAFTRLPQRYNLVAQSSLTGDTRTYTYRHHLLLRYTTYNGFAHGLGWVSLDALRERWAGSPLAEPEIAARNPITLDNSYQARAVGTTTADGSDEVRIAYLDPDTTRLTEADGGVLEFTFNEQWLATDVRRLLPGGVPPQSLGRQMWDDDGNLTAETDAQGNTTRYGYDDAGNLIRSTDAKGHTTRIEYDPHNQPIVVTDPLGHSTHYKYDEAGRLLESTDALGQTTKYIYDTKGQLVNLTDARGGNKQLTYDTAGRLTAYTDCSNSTTRYDYDTHGRLTRETDAVGHKTHYQYDALGRLSAVTQPDGRTEQFRYDAENNLIAHRDAKGQITRYRYNGHDLPIERIDPKGQSLQYRYDKALRLSELINANGESYKFSYDAESRLASETGFDGKTTSYQYDGAGQLIGSTCQGIKTEYLRDALGLLTAKVNADGAVRYAYDAVGRLTAMASPQAEHRFLYDPLSQLIEERSAYILKPPKLPGEPVIPTAAFTLTHSYDALGNRLQTTLPNGRRIDTQRYGSGHWHGTLWQGKSLVNLERDPLHRETQREIGSGAERLKASFAYDPQSRLTAITLNKGQQRLRERRYTYDDTGNLTQVQDAQRGTLRYGYDPLGQLLSAVQPDLSETFAFDPAGNVLEAANEAGKTPAPPASPNELTQREPTARIPSPKIEHNRLIHYLDYSYDYDVQGNTVRKRLRAQTSVNEAATLAFAYDAENRLITATRAWDNATQITHYRYDAFGRRIAKQVTEQHGEPKQNTKTQTSITTLFVWDGDVLAQEIHADKTITYVHEPDSFVPLARIESSEGLTAYAPDSVHLSHTFAWDLPGDLRNPAGQAHADRLHEDAQHEAKHRAAWQQRQEQAKAKAASDRIHYYHTDHLGTPLELTDEHGKVVWAARYKAWGRILRYDVRDVEQPLRFQGQYEDAETGLYYNRHRYYDPDTARFITQDPIGLEGGENLYQYAPNGTGWIDPLGLAKGKGGCDPCAKYDVGRFDDLQRRSKPGDGLDIHHAMQKHPAGQVVPGYDLKTGPSIAVPKGEHGQIPTMKGTYTGTARHLLATDIKALRKHTNAPNDCLKKLINLNKTMFPDAFKKPKKA